MNYKKQYLIQVEPVPEEVDKVWGVLIFSLKKEFPNDLDLAEDDLSIYQDVWDKAIERLEGIYYADLWDEATRQKVVEWMRKQKRFQQTCPNNFTDPDWYGFRL